MKMAALDSRGRQIIEGDTVTLRGKVLSIVSGGYLRVSWNGPPSNCVDFILPKVCKVEDGDKDV